MTNPTVMIAASSQHQNVVEAALGSESVSTFVLENGESVVRYFLNQRFLSVGRIPSIWNDLLRPILQMPRSCDLVFLDLHLPKLDGLAVLRQLRCLYRDDFSSLPPIVLLSDRDDDESLVESAFQLGCNGFLKKSKWAIDNSDAICQSARYWLQATVRPTASSSRRVGESARTKRPIAHSARFSFQP